MPERIDSTYEILEPIGSGGGGVVYLAWHKRLHKKVVLKVDKRKLNANLDALRRDVEMLKNLSHTYIPQVYDFLVEGETVYTVMDYIEGESFDKPLRRGQRFTQPQVIHWACQLLDALIYLHSRPPHGILHSDIKPANVMLTPQGDIRLIDFNIALQLGAEGAMAVGRSFGYASPEHYWSSPVSAAEASNMLTDGVETVVSLANSRRLLDVRSDIYSLGATLYHILSGKRPARRAEEVEPLADSAISPGVAAILAKAMNPDPALRYQTAKEMLFDFEHLRERDARTRRLRRAAALNLVLTTAVFLLGACLAFVGLKRMELTKGALVMAEYSAAAFKIGDVPGALAYASQALPLRQGLFTPSRTPQAQKALTDALGVYDLADGFKAHRCVELPSQPFKLILSPNGRTAAAVYAYALRVFDTETGETRGIFPAEPSALADAVFVGDSALIFCGDGAVTALDIESMGVVWTGGPGTTLAVSGDGRIVAAVYKDQPEALLYESKTGKRLARIDMGKGQSVGVNDRFANPNNNLLCLSQDGRRLAASFADGSLSLIDTQSGKREQLLEPGGRTHFEGGFCGSILAFSAAGEGENIFATVDTQSGEQLGGFSSALPFLVQANADGVFISTQNLLVELEPRTGAQKELAYTGADIAAFARDDNHVLAATRESDYAFFNARGRLLTKRQGRADFVCVAGDYALLGSRDSPTVRVMKRKTYPDAQIFRYDPDTAHDEARLSQDGKTVMLFSYDHFSLYGRDGQLLAQADIPQAEQVYDQQFVRDGKGERLEVTYYDGTVAAYSTKDGTLMLKVQGEPPDPSLMDTFQTERYRIEAPLHGAPVVYQGTKKMCELEKDAYLTYVTQVGQNLVTEYISVKGERYALLLDAQCQTLAVLPNLCDIVGDELIFDDRQGGVLYKSPIYTLDQLLALQKKATNT